MEATSPTTMTEWIPGTGAVQTVGGGGLEPAAQGPRTKSRRERERVCVVIPRILEACLHAPFDIRLLDAPTGVAQEKGQHKSVDTKFSFSPLPSAVLCLVLSRFGFDRPVPSSIFFLCLLAKVNTVSKMKLSSFGLSRISFF